MLLSFRKPLTYIQHFSVSTVQKRFMHVEDLWSNDYYVITTKINLEGGCTVEESAYLKQVQDFVKNEIHNDMSFSGIISSSAECLGHQIHPQSFVTVIDELYNSMEIEIENILYLDNIGFYESNMDLKADPLKKYKEFLYEENSSDTSSSTESSLDTSSTSTEGYDDVIPIGSEWGFLTYMFSGLLISLVIVIAAWLGGFFNKKNKPTNNDVLIDNDELHSFYDSDIIYDIQLIKKQLILLFVPYCLFIMYSYRYYYYYKLKFYMLKENPDIKTISTSSITNSCVRGLRSITRLCSPISLTITKRHYPGNDKFSKVAGKIGEKCVGAGCNSTRPFLVPLSNKPVNNSNIDNKVSKPSVPVVDTDHNHILNFNEITKPFSSIADNVRTRTDSKNIEENNVQQLNNNIENTPITPNTENLNTYANITCGIGAGVVASIINSKGPSLELEKTESYISENNNNSRNESEEEYDAVQKLNKAKLNEAILESKSNAVARNGDTENNLKPSEITLKTVNNKSYTTTMTKNSKPEDFTNEQTIDEMEKRQTLIKQKALNDGHFKKQEILLKNGETHNLNISKYNAKLTPQGFAYLKKIEASKQPANKVLENNHNQNQEGWADNKAKFVHPEEKIQTQIEEDSLVIIAPPPAADDLLIETSKQNHLLIGNLLPDGRVICRGFLTSKTTGTLFSDKQYKAFQHEQENKIEISIKEQKSQFFVPFNNANIVEKKDVKLVKYSEEYLKTISEDIENLLKTVATQQKQKDQEPYDIHGVTKTQGIEICKEYDKVALAKEKDCKSNAQHPLTEEQKKINKQNQEKQKNSSKPKKASNNHDNNNDEETL